MTKLAKYEKETVVNFNEAEKDARIYGFQFFLGGKDAA